MATLEIKSRKIRGKTVHVVDTRGLPNGGRKFFVTKNKAEEHLKSIGVELQSGGILSPEERRDFYAAKAILNGVGTMVDAARFYVTHNKKVEPILLATAIDDCIAAKERSGKRKRYISQLRINLRRFLKSFPNRMLGEIRREEIETFIFGTRAKPNTWKQSTRRALLIDIRTLFNYARGRNLIGLNPCAGIERIEVDDKPPSVLSVEDAQRLLERCSKVEPRVVPFVAVQLFAGLRPLEARRLSSEDIQGNYIHVHAAKSKTRQRRLVPINDTLRAWIGAEPKLPVVNLERRWRRVRYECTGETGPRKKKIWKPLFKLPPDVLRHSFCSYALPVMGAAKVAEIAGHSETILFKHYREIVTKEQSEAFFKILP